MCRNIAQSPLEAQFQLPCYMLTVLDCFSEGGYFFPYEDYLEKMYPYSWRALQRKTLT